MKDYLKLMLVVPIFVLLSGCILFPEEDLNVVRTEGASISFEGDTPPEVILDNEEFLISFTVTNLGNYDIQKGEMNIELFGGLFTPSKKTWTNEEMFRGAYLSEQFGSVELVDMGTATDSVEPAIGADGSFSVNALMCYTYKTTAYGRICFPQGNDPAPFCDNYAEKLSNVSAAPITVTSITQQGYSTSVDVYIKVNNAKGKKAYLLTSDCQEKKDLDEITLESFTIDGVDYLEHCDKTVDLDSEGNGEFRCNIEKEVSSTIESIAKVVLAYKYSDEVTKTVSVRA